MSPRYRVVGDMASWIKYGSIGDMALRCDIVTA